MPTIGEVLEPTTPETTNDSRMWFTTERDGHIFRVWGSAIVGQAALETDCDSQWEAEEAAARLAAIANMKHFAGNGGRPVLEALPGLAIETFTSTRPSHLEKLEENKLINWLAERALATESDLVTVVNLHAQPKTPDPEMLRHHAFQTLL